MNLLKYTTAVVVTLLTFPVSWYLAYISGGVYFFLFSFWIPGCGLISFLIFNLLGVGSLHVFLSLTLALLFIGPGTLLLIDFLTK